MESYSKMLLQGWSSPSTPVIPAQWGLLHWFISKNGPKDDYESIPDGLFQDGVRRRG